MEFLTQYKYVVIDLETTGNRAKHGDEIIQIGLCVIENGQIVEKFSSFVKPTVKIPAFIEQLTGITEQDVQFAPTIGELLPEIIKRLDQACFVAHNVHFDLSFYQSVLEEHGYQPFNGPIIDTVELSRILWPEREGYKLKQLSIDFDVEHEHPHQADSDALATAHLFLQLCNQIYDLPLITIQRMIPLAKTLHSDIDILLRRVESATIIQQAKTSGQKQDQNIEIYRHFALRNMTPDRVEKHSLNPSLSPINKALQSGSLSELSLKELLAPAWLDYEERAGQEAFFQQIIHSFSVGQHGIAEAGTGTGKTLAYLFAAALWSYTQQEKVVISTHTIPLQEQILQKEWPIVQEALPFDVHAAVIKGKHHYVCMSRLEQVFVHQLEEHNYDSDLTKLQLLVWLTRTTTGDVEELNLTAGGKELWKKIQTEGSACFQRDCPWYQRCFYFKAKRSAQLADLVVTNHALLVADEAYGHVLPSYRYVVIDEAHHLEHGAIEHLGITVAYAGLHAAYQRLLGGERNTLPLQLTEMFQLLMHGPELQQIFEQFGQQLLQVKELYDQLFSLLYLLAKEKDTGLQEGNKKFFRIQHQAEQHELWVQALQVAELVEEDTNEALQLFYKLYDQLGQETAELSAAQKQLVQEYKRIGEELEQQFRALTGNILKAEPQKYVYWLEYDLQGNRYQMSLHQKPLNVADYLNDTIFGSKESVILTSATLQVKHSFKYMLEQLGLQEQELSIQHIQSPFNYQEQAQVIISEDISLLSQVSEADFARELADSICQIAQITQGRMLVLFTSYRLLKLTHEQLKQPLLEQGIFLYAQGVDSGSRTKLSKNFQSQEQAVLLGTNSFWEGIDIPGEDLSCLIIVKLPFTPPNTPFYEAKAEELKRAGRNPFMDYALPQAVIRFKQGFGRLIRREKDRGVVIIFDKRIISAKYGKLFLDSLPVIPIKVLKKKEMLEDLQVWFAR